MRHVLLLAAAITPLIIAGAQEAAAQRGRDAVGGTYIPGGHGGGAWRGGGGWQGGGGAWRGGGTWRGTRWHGGGWNRPYVRSGWGWRRGYSRYDRGWNSGWGWDVAGLAAGAALGAAPYYYDPYVYSYPVYAAPVSGSIGGYCATPVRTCRLIDPAVIGGGCSCRVAGGRARGIVVGP